MKKIVLTLIASLLCFFASAQISIQEARALWKEWDEVHATYAHDYARLKSEKKLNFRLLSEPKRTYVLRLTNFIITTERIDADNLIFGQASEYLSKQADSWRDKINQLEKDEPDELIFSSEEKELIALWINLVRAGARLDELLDFLYSEDKKWLVSQKSRFVKGYYYMDDMLCL